MGRLLVMAMVLSGCDLILPLSGSVDLATSSEAPGDPDGRPSTKADHGLPEGGPLDTRSDDTTVVDTPPCAPGMLENNPYGASAMAICQDPSGTAYLQCEAHNLCNSTGWSLCTKSEFFAHGGATIPSPEIAWIAACSVVTAQTYGPPQDGLCDCFPNVIVDAVTGIWDCAGSAIGTQTGNPLALATFTECRRVGDAKQYVQAHWTAFYSYLQAEVTAALCCRN